MKTKFYKCNRCGNIVNKIKDTGVPIICCGQPMELLEANTTEASTEKHLPEVKLEGSTLKVNVGSVQHPMASEHYIEWVYVETETGGYRKDLKPGSEPTVTFELGDEKPVAVYSYCNLHGLWKTSI